MVLLPDVKQRAEADQTPGTEATTRLLPPEAVSIPIGDVQPLDLETALRLAGVENLVLNLARRRVVESVSVRQLAPAQILPTIDLVTNYDSHTGNLQQPNGTILAVDRSSFYVEAVANAIGSGTITIPGVSLGDNIAQGIVGFLTSRQFVVQREYAATAIGTRSSSRSP